MGAGSEVLGTPVRPQDIVDDVVAAEADGFRSAWTVHFSRGVNALGVLAVAGTQTSQIDLGVGIVPTYPRHPLALAQQAATAQAFCGGRLTLGVGVSHRPVIEDLHGLAYQQPAAHMRDYLSVLVPLLREGSVRHRGTFYRVDGGFTVPGTSPVEVLVGALSPLMVQAAGELADGVVTWLAGPRTLGEDIIPQLHRAAGTSAAGTGAAGTSAAGTGAAGTSAAGTGAAGTRAAGTGAAGTGAAGTGAAGTGAAGTGAAAAGPPPAWWPRFRSRSRPAPRPRGGPLTRSSPGTPGSTTTAGCWSGRVPRRRAPWPSPGPRPGSRNSSGGWPTSA